MHVTQYPSDQSGVLHTGHVLGLFMRTATMMRRRIPCEAFVLALGHIFAVSLKFFFPGAFDRKWEPPEILR